ncbi:polymerase (DNA directed), epsilon 3, accessory subunit [Columba livia]|uniref:Polymerase (DNA directed), epsilon 3, accessory subunit n=1 Tax=Columba livia TaxID=8932 RepID=A0A2I0LT23_COLLI|nr:polymerase (DNA directed), epsilon 3, accessory subunit [Columba livia]
MRRAQGPGFVQRDINAPNQPRCVPSCFQTSFVLFLCSPCLLGFNLYIKDFVNLFPCAGAWLPPASEQPHGTGPFVLGWLRNKGEKNRQMLSTEAGQENLRDC